MFTVTATRKRLTSVSNTLYHPLDYYFTLFLRAKKTEGLKPRTLNDHESHFRYLQRWLAEQYPALKLEELTADHVRQYVQHMLTEQTLYTGHPTLETHNTAKGLSPATVNIRTRTLKCFLRFLHDEGYLQADLASRVKLQRSRRDTIGAFEKEQVLQLLAAPNQREYLGFRDYVLLTLLFDTVFLLNNGKPLTYNQAYERIRLYGEKAGITGVRVSPHTFRHTFATLYVKSGGDPFSLQRILGHHDISMVRKYVQLNNRDLQEQHAQSSPLVGM